MGFGLALYRANGTKLFSTDDGDHLMIVEVVPFDTDHFTNSGSTSYRDYTQWPLGSLAVVWYGPAIYVSSNFTWVNNGSGMCRLQNSANAVAPGQGVLSAHVCVYSILSG